jgi:hypothetical protein
MVGASPAAPENAAVIPVAVLRIARPAWAANAKSAAETWTKLVVMALVAIVRPRDAVMPKLFITSARKSAVMKAPATNVRMSKHAVGEIVVLQGKGVALMTIFVMIFVKMGPQLATVISATTMMKATFVRDARA